MADPELPDAMRDELRAAWHRYLDLLAPLRPGLFAYCRRLTGDVWDAEDLVQDTLLRAFGVLGRLHQEIRNPRAYVLRTATHLWIDALRRRGTETASVVAQAIEPPRPAPSPEQSGAVREAGAALLRRLAPQERAAIVLKEVFDLSLEETAMVLETTLGAVKAALHRARARLRESDAGSTTRRPAPSAALVDRFVAAFNAGDRTALLALVLDAGSVDMVGCGLQYGRDALEGEQGWLRGALDGHPEWPAEYAFESQRLERTELDGESVALYFRTRRGREALEQVLRFEEAEGGVARIRDYAFCPETLREIGARLGLHVRTGLYRYPTPAPGEPWPRPAADA
jgi:RNA polymerase sigma-70 factor (ECF subfamily)